MWPVSYSVLILGGVKTGAAVYPQLSVICALLSTLCYLRCFCYVSHNRLSSNQRAWPFYSCSYFPAGTEIGVFPPSWWCACRICCAHLRRWQPLSVFSWQGAVGYSAWLNLGSSWGRPRAPWPPMLVPAHTAHTPTTASRSKTTRWRGCRVQSDTEGNSVPSANGVHMSYLGSKGLWSQAQQITQTVLEGTWPQTHITQAHKITLPLPLSLSIFLHAANWTSWRFLMDEKECQCAGLE